MLSALTSQIEEARRILWSARDNLDAALAATPGADEDCVLATPALLELVLHAVQAKRELDRLERLLAAKWRGRRCRSRRRAADQQPPVGKRLVFSRARSGRDSRHLVR
jgi:hypothetical protein